jgi:alanine racemase
VAAGEGVSSRPGPAVSTALLTKWAEVEAAAIRDNLAALRRAVGEGVRVMAMVKADGYGHGATPASRAALEGGASWLGVSSAEEALALRRDGIGAPVLVVGWTPPSRMEELIRARVHLTVWSEEQVRAAAAAAGEEPALLHLKVDSGMGRLGCRPEELPGLAAAVDAAGRRARPVGLLTHFADAEGDPAFTRLQDRLFVEAAAELTRRWPGVLLHAANSAAALLHPETRHDLVRCGIAIYGYPPPNVPEGSGFRPALRMVARVAQVKTVRRGESVGYGRTWIAERSTRVATVAAGYADGVQRAQSNRGMVLVGGRRCPIVGRVSMDQMAVDVSEVGAARPGDEVVIIGCQGEERLGAEAVAAASGTISYEVLCAVSARVPRIAR